jgi:hypothetical protein
MDRLVDVPGAINFRDFGGYETHDVARVRRGLQRPDERDADPEDRHEFMRAITGELTREHFLE